MVEEIVFKNKENKQIFELLSKFTALKTRAKELNGPDKIIADKEYKNFLNVLIKKFSYIPELHARRYIKYTNYQDVLQEGLLGLVMALDKFDIDRSRNFFQLANWYVKTRVCRSANKFNVISIPIAQGKEKALLRMDEPTGMADTRCTQAEQLECVQQSEIMKRTLSILPKDSLNVFCSYHGFNVENGEVSVVEKKTIADIAQDMKISRARVKKLIDTANHKLLLALS